MEKSKSKEPWDTISIVLEDHTLQSFTDQASTLNKAGPDSFVFATQWQLNGEKNSEGKRLVDGVIHLKKKMVR